MFCLFVMHCMNRMSTSQIPVHILMSLADIYPCISSSAICWRKAFLDNRIVEASSLFGQ